MTGASRQDTVRRGEQGTYVTRQGYGHEEWLNRSEWIVDGWRYGYIEGVARSPALQGTKIGLVLFAITPEKQRVIVGRIGEANVLTEDQASLIHSEFKRRGWIKQMITEVQQRTGDSRRFKKSIAGPLALANIRFRSSGLKMFDPPILVPANDSLNRFSRYRLMAADQRFVKRWTERLKRAAMQGLRSTEVRQRGAVRATLIDPIEAKMQNELRALLEQRYGRDAVEAERDYADLRITADRRLVVIEIKSSLRARLAVRQALGQLLEYSCFQHPKDQPELVVVGRGLATAAEAKYVRRLRDRFQIPLRYLQYVPGSNRFAL